MGCVLHLQAWQVASPRLHSHSRTPVLSRSPPPPQQLHIPESDLNLGECFETASRAHKFHVENSSDAPVTVTSISGNCDCQSWQPATPFTIAARGRQEIRMMLGLRMTSDCSRVRGDESVTIPLRVTFSGQDGHDRAKEWALRGTLKPSFKLGAPVRNNVLSLGMITVARIAVQQEIAIVAADHVKSIEARGSKNWLVMVRRGSSLTKSEFIASLAYQGTRTPLQFDDTLELVPTDSNGQQLPAIPLRVVGEIVDPVIASPRALYFGRRAIGKTYAEDILLRSLDGTAFAIDRVECRGEGLSSLRSTTATAGEVCRVSWDVANADTLEGELQIRLKDGSIIKVPVVGFGIDAK